MLRVCSLATSVLSVSFSALSLFRVVCCLRRTCEGWMGLEKGQRSNHARELVDLIHSHQLAFIRKSISIDLHVFVLILEDLEVLSASVFSIRSTHFTCTHYSSLLFGLYFVFIRLILSLLSCGGKNIFEISNWACGSFSNEGHLRCNMITCNSAGHLSISIPRWKQR